MTRFAPFVEFFEIQGIPILGNFDNGCIVGLTPEATRVCQCVLNGERPPETIKAEDENLYTYLTSNGFFDTAPKHDHLESAYLHVTQRCNLSCRGCYSFDNTRNAIEDPTFENLVKALEGLCSCGVSDLKITGGEPFLREDLPEILRAAKERFGFEKTTIAANGTCVSDEQLAPLAPWTDMIVVAFDGASESSPAHIALRKGFDMLFFATFATSRDCLQLGLDRTNCVRIGL